MTCGIDAEDDRRLPLLIRLSPIAAIVPFATTKTG
jgi:hypothetical protein